MNTPTEVAVVDFETRSYLKLGRGGTNPFIYAKHPTTDVWLGRYGYDNDPDTVRELGFAAAMPADLRAHIEAGGKVSAHNLSFEYAIWNYLLVPRYGWCPLPLEQCDDTAARGARLGLPRSLEKMAPAIGLAQVKDTEGATAMKRMAKPRKVHDLHSFSDAEQEYLADEPGTWTVWYEGGKVLEWWDVPERVERLGRYCSQDYHTQMGLHLALPPLPQAEWEVWQATMRANIRGARLDRTLVERACRLIELRLARYADELQRMTGGQVKSHTDLNGMKAWLTDQGYPLESLDKNVVAALLENHEVEDHIKEMVAIRAEAGKSSVAKFPAMQQHMDEQDLAYDLLVYWGATATGRWSGAGIQVQNLPARGRLKYQDAEMVIALLTDPASLTDRQLLELSDLVESLWDGSVIEALSMALRGAIRAREGYELYVADFSNIEGRKAAWLAGEEWKLQAFRDYDTVLGYDDKGEAIRKGPDLYKVAAGGILGIPPEEVVKRLRDALGKVSELALQFQGGAGAFVSMAKTYRVNIEDYRDEIEASIDPAIIEELPAAWDLYGKKSSVQRHVWEPAEMVKRAWRARHPRIVQSWSECEDAAVSAILEPGTKYHACDRKLRFQAQYAFGKLFLCMTLPSGRGIFYPNVRLRTQTTPWGDRRPAIVFDKVEQGRVRREATYAGDLFQSAVQGSSRDIMANGWLNVEAIGYEPLFSVHDEEVSEQLIGLGDLVEYEAALCRLPDWAAGLPVTAAGYVSDRFRKD